jgi:hypothetical protein
VKVQLDDPIPMTNEPALPNGGRNISQVEPIYVFVFGIFAVLAGLTIALVNQNPPSFPRVIITVFIGLGGASIASGITGFLEIQSRWVRAGGPLGVLVFLCFFIWQSAGQVDPVVPNLLPASNPSSRPQ